MQQFRVPLIALFLAIFFGVKAGTPATPSTSGSASSHGAAEPKKTAGKNKKASAGAPASNAGVANPCDKRASSALDPGAFPTKDCEPLPGYWKALCELNPAYTQHGLLPAISELKKEDNAQNRQDLASTCLGSEKGKILLTVATVPDPLRTHVGVIFDRSLEAIQAAASQNNFLPFSHYLSWQPPMSTATDEKSTPAPDTVDLSVLIFRKQKKAGHEEPFDYLAVFLVSELPTQGLNAREFLSARRIIRILDPAQTNIWIAGPTFSGSVASLRDLDDGLGDDICVQAFSGSIANAPLIFPRTHKRCVANLSLLQAQQRDAFTEFVSAARAFGYSPEDIALLSEEGTKYGAIPKPDKTAIDASNPKKPSKDGEPAEHRGIGDVLLLNFPREISKLRNAAGTELPATSEAANQPPELRLQWQDPLGAKADDLPDYGLQTPNSQQAVLANISTALRVHGIKVLGLLATDPMDEAFLLRSLKESTHDIRFLLRDPDLLYLRTPDIGSLNGTLLLSNFPLIPENQDWSRGVETTLQAGDDEGDKPDTDHLLTFASSTQEGEYNAFIKLLEAATGAPRTLPLLESDWPLGAAAEKLPEELAKDPMPPLWLATIGTAGHLPLKVLSRHDAAIEYELHLNSLAVGKPFYAPMLLWLLSAAVGLVHIGGLLFHDKLPGRYRHDFNLISSADAVGPIKAACHVTAILCIALVQWILGSSYLFFRSACYAGGHASLGSILTSRSNDTSALYFLLSAVVTIETLALLASIVWMLRKIHARGWFRPGLLTPFVIFVGAGVWWSFAVFPANLQHAFLHFRDLNVTSGVAPALPLAFLISVFYIGIWTFIRRLAYWHYRYTAIRTLSLDPFVNNNFAASGSAIDFCMLGKFKNGIWTVAFWLSLGASTLLFRPWVTIDMLEGLGVRALVSFFLILVLLAVWLNWFRFLSVWTSLQEILNCLETLPIKGAFSRMPRGKSLPIWQWRTSDSCMLLCQVVDKLRALLAVNPNAVGDDVVDPFNEWVSQQGCLDCVDDASKEAQLATLNGVLAASLKQHYQDEMISGSDAKANAAPNVAGKPDEFELREDIVALPFYDYIRHVVIELRNLLFFVVAAFCLLFAALHIYAYRADTAIDWSMIALFCVLGTGVVIVLAQMERNPLLNRLGDGTSGGLGKGFYFDLLKYGTIPLLTVLGSQVPFISNNVLRWLQPAVEALR